MPSKIIFTKEQDDFIREFAPKINRKKLAEEFEKKFNQKIYYETLVRRRKELGVPGIDGRFPKGFTPWNKGKPMSKEAYERLKPTMFKKGDMPKNKKECLPIGSEMITKERIYLDKS